MGQERASQPALNGRVQGASRSKSQIGVQGDDDGAIAAALLLGDSLAGAVDIAHWAHRRNRGARAQAFPHYGSGLVDGGAAEGGVMHDPFVPHRQACIVRRGKPGGDHGSQVGRDAIVVGIVALAIRGLVRGEGGSLLLLGGDAKRGAQRLVPVWWGVIGWWVAGGRTAGRRARTGA